ncbi:hypothetical protein K1719_011789 [Acacia pycnantha]|nr:hypothetical protein K1719_011789 [Acacia pycnantha]
MDSSQPSDPVGGAVSSVEYTCCYPLLFLYHSSSLPFSLFNLCFHAWISPPNIVKLPSKRERNPLVVRDTETNARSLITLISFSLSCYSFSRLLVHSSPSLATKILLASNRLEFH